MGSAAVVVVVAESISWKPLLYIPIVALCGVLFLAVAAVLLCLYLLAMLVLRPLAPLFFFLVLGNLWCPLVCLGMLVYHDPSSSDIMP
jgi:hypothetical protein